MSDRTGGWGDTASAAGMAVGDAEFTGNGRRVHAERTLATGYTGFQYSQPPVRR
ncbi:hypothetical protein AXF42_Ash010164 [Apostasia shenzhenica]|uniref:Uncharacterized protein n=1 Tax=Apostasia shenzhenica TaxID=1088818 RepID=A0A2I0A9R1_9ASPA|nr:hypothetical protein AXF42_Ash010164 [Apostasia shenzhenica]